MSSGRQYVEQPTSRGRPQDNLLTISDILRTSVKIVLNRCSTRVEHVLNTSALFTKNRDTCQTRV